MRSWSTFTSRGFWAAAMLIVGCGAVMLPHLGDAGEAVPTFTVERGVFERRVAADGYLKAVRATQLALPPTLRGALRIAWLAPDGSRVKTGEPVVRLDPTEMEKQLRDAEDQFATSGLEIEKEQSTSRAELENLGRDADLADLELAAQQDFSGIDETILSRHEIIEASIDRELAAERKGHAVDARDSQDRVARAEMEVLGIEQRRARQKIEEAQEHLASLELRAPHDGLVVFRRDWQGNMPRVGDTVFRGNALAEIPDLSEMEAEVYVLEADAGGLAAGKPATVILDAHPEAVHRAEVARVEALAKPRLRGSPVQYFAATLRLAATDPTRMKPGQRVRAELLLERLEGVLVVPRQAVFEREGRKVVLKRRGDGFEAVAVRLGEIGLGQVVVEEGLEEGDVIALADPGRAAADESEKEGGTSPALGGPREASP